ncbi:hypothetical protein [Methylovulum psychrotolerans]|uniref:Uncharacterized protein n=1 Tax=Methylovulum psychrotolerans TaxID=1704499 RepID=A0A1Z4BU09_9GAMM|nr:hypothetical protein [Methylovulum psychrotolerans]ASF44794.1 hypothetical protein CEK71_01225 [Methylovulum psychrotolerans]
MQSTVEFDSELFSPYLPDESQVNPHCYGAELAYWLSRKLADHGIVTSYPNAEDWGWFIEYLTESGDEFWLCCSNRNSSAKQWQCFIEAKTKRLFGRNKPKIECAKSLLKALCCILEEEQEVKNIRWCKEPWITDWANRPE